jgi:transcriptional regulator with XRE-family HTH domain
MGNPRPKPKRLADKLRSIRLGLGLSQTEMLRRLGLEDSMHYSRISEYEQGTREPSLLTLLQYARSAGVHMEHLVDDDVHLPLNLPGEVKPPTLKRKPVQRKKT